MLSVKICEKPSCCVLDQLETGKRLLIYQGFKDPGGLSAWGWWGGGAWVRVEGRAGWEQSSYGARERKRLDSWRGGWWCDEDCPSDLLPWRRGTCFQGSRGVELVGLGRIGEQERCGRAAVVAGGSGGAPCVVLVGGGSWRGRVAAKSPVWRGPNPGEPTKTVLLKLSWSFFKMAFRSVNSLVCHG